MIQRNKVTWYSQIVAIILGVAIFITGYKIGTDNIEKDDIASDPAVEEILINEVSDNSNFRTIPDVRFDDYRNSDRFLANPRGISEVENNDFYIENYKEYPNLAGYYIPVGNHIDEVKELDIDDDNENEMIIYYSCYGCNAPSRNIDIIKENRIIFTAEGGNLRIEPIENEKGFYIFTTFIPRGRGETKVEFRLNSDNQYYAKSEEDIYYDSVE